MNKYKIKTLANGLRAVLVPMPQVKSITVLALVKAGTRFEEEKNNGISHFLEHMAFKGTEKYPTAYKLASAVEAVGAEFNAFTGKEYTGYYVKAAAEKIKIALDVVSEMVFHQLILQKELELERKVILEEIRMYKDLPMAIVNDEFASLIYSNTPLGWTTLGNPDNIETLLKNDFNKYLGLYYQANRMALGIAGDEETVGSKSVWQLVEEVFGKSGIDSQETVVEEKFSFSQKKPAIKVVNQKTEQTHLCLGVRGFKKSDKRRYALAVLTGILGGGMSSRLFSEIREKRGLAYYINTGLQGYADNGHMLMKAGIEAKNISEVIKIALNEFNKITNGKLNQKELDRTKEYLKGQFILSLEDSQAVADMYAEDLLMERQVRRPKDVLKAIDKVTKEAVQKVAQAVFVNKGLNLAVISPKADKQKLEKELRF